MSVNALLNRNETIAGLILLFLFAIFMFADKLTAPPAVRSTNAADQFNTHRALDRTAEILGDERPHPVDTPANDAVRARLISQIRLLGFEPELTTAPACWSSGDTLYISCATVKNVSFRIGPRPQAGERNTILATSHYDSVPAGPGAADAQLGVSVLLETAYHLSKQELSRPILFLFTDGEEGGLFGARAFVKRDPRASEVDLVINFEARGVEGPAYMFETSQPNGLVIPAFMHAVRNPTANSLMAAIYERLPNSTDVAVYLPEGWNALNFAIIGREAYYHTPYDNMENLSRDSVQHMGDLGLATLRKFSTTDVPQDNKRLIYTDIAGRGMIALPESFAIPLLAIAISIALIGFRYLPANNVRIVSIRTTILTFAMPLLMLIAAGLLGYGTQFIIDLIREEPSYWRTHGWASHGWATLIGIALACILPSLISRKITRQHLFTASWFWFSVVGLVIAIILPGASVLFVLPAVLFAISTIVGIAFLPAAIVLEVIAALLALILFAPNIASFGTSLGYGVAFFMSVLTAVALLPWLSIINLVPDEGDSKPQKKLSIIGGVSIVATIIFIVLSCILPAYSIKGPRHQNILTYADHDAQKAWLTFGDGVMKPPASMRNIGDIQSPALLVPEFNARVWHQEIAMPEQTAPMVEVISKKLDEGKNHIVSLRVNAPDADGFTIWLPLSTDPKKIAFEDLEYPIKPVDGREFALLRCSGRQCASQEIVLTLGNQEAASMLIYSEYFGAKGAAIPFANVRPAHVTARQRGDRLLVIKRYSL